MHVKQNKKILDIQNLLITTLELLLLLVVVVLQLAEKNC